MREVLVLASVVAVLASLTAPVTCDDDHPKTTSSLPPRIDQDHSSEMENRFCDNVIITDTVHVPAFTDQHHRLMQIHVRTNLQVRTASITLCYLSVSYLQCTQ